MNVETALGN